MGFEDFFEHKNKHYKHGHDHHYGHDQHYNHDHHYDHDHHYGHDDHYRHDDYRRSSHSYNHHSDIKQMLLYKLRNNPKLKGFLFFAAIIIILLLIGVAILLFPLILKLLSFIAENGVQGIIDFIWKGTK